MPLNCDCYAGCWAKHSERWARYFPNDIDKAYGVCTEKLEYGTYVRMPDHIRLENEMDAKILNKALE